jgi:hypothetical protein
MTERTGRHPRLRTACTTLLAPFVLAATLGGSFSVSQPASAQAACTLIVPSRAGWAADMCGDPSVPSSMAVSVDGKAKGMGALVRLYQNTDDNTRQPAVMALYASSYLRLKEGADPSPPVPFGASVILSDAYWSGGVYHGNATLTSLAISTSGFPNYISMRATGTNGSLVSTFNLLLLAPTDAKSTLYVARQTTAAADIAIDANRAANGEGDKILAGGSTMWINDTGPCAGGYVNCHDANLVRVSDNHGTVHQARFADLAIPGFLFPAPVPLGRWMDIDHTDGPTWQGATPSIRICLDTLSSGRSYRAQGYLATNTNVNLDNVGGPWVEDDWRAGTGWRKGQTESVGFRIVAAASFAAAAPTSC